MPEQGPLVAGAHFWALGRAWVVYREWAGEGEWAGEDLRAAPVEDPHLDTHYLVSGLVNQGIPIGGVGWQMHKVNPFRFSSANHSNAQRLANPFHYDFPRQ